MEGITQDRAAYYLYWYFYFFSSACLICCGKGRTRFNEEILFDGKHRVSRQETMEKMNYYINKAEEGMRIFNNKEKNFNIAREIRSELDKEYKNNSLKRTDDIYNGNKLFHYYIPAVHESDAAIVSRFAHKNLYSFLYDVENYMRHYISKLIYRIIITLFFTQANIILRRI